MTLPATPVSATAGAGATGTYAIQISGVSGTPDFSNGTYTGWAADLDSTPPIASQNPVLYSTYGYNLPPNAASENWDKVNYLLNHKQGTPSDIQAVIRTLLTNQPLIFPTQAGVDLLADANANGHGYIPAPGQIMAVLLYQDGFGGITEDDILEAIVPACARIGDFVWNDLNWDGVQQPNEPGLNGITVVLQKFTESGLHLVDATVTSNAPAGYLYPGPNPAGYYQFTGVCPGSYWVIVDPAQPGLSSFSLSPTLIGSDPTADSNGSPGITTIATIHDADETIDFGFTTGAPPSPISLLQVCNVAGTGIIPGTNFNFNVAGTPQSVTAGLAPAGTCGTPVTVPAGVALITEAMPTGTVLTGVNTTPSGLLVNSNLSSGTVIVTINAGSQTIVTFIDAAPPAAPVTGFVQVCKVAGAGVSVGANFNFDVGGTPVTVPAGLSPGGSCGMPVSAAPGTLVVTETIPAGTVLAGVSTLPNAGLLAGSDLMAGTATVTVLAGAQTVVTFIDAVAPMPATSGYLQVCKIAGPGVAIGANFNFNVAGIPQTVSAGPAPGGSCAAPVTVPAGAATITETALAGTAVIAIGTLPSSSLLVNRDLATGTAIVTVLAGGQTIVTFTDADPTFGLHEAFQVRYASNLNVGDSVINITNTGTSANTGGGFGFSGGNLCVNIYTFDQSEELLSCCSCFVTPNGLKSVSVKGSLISNSLTPELPNSVVIKLLATPAGATGSSCDASAPTMGGLAPGARAWGTTLHVLPTNPPTYAVTETPFAKSDLSQGELNHLTSFCSFIQSNASGFGICGGCTVGGLGATTQR